MADLRDRIALLGRSVFGAVGSPVSYRHTTDGPGWPPLPAGADVLEGVAVDRVAADAAVFDTEAATYYGNGVEGHGSDKDTFGRGGASFRDSGEGVPSGSLRDAPGKAAHSTYVERKDAYEERSRTFYDLERARLARLSRWQEQR